MQDVMPPGLIKRNQVARDSDDSGTESERDRIRHHQQRIQQQKAMMSASPCS